MTHAVTIAPAMTGLRDWLRSQDIAGVVGERVYVGGLPADATRPCVAILRVGGSVDDTVLDRALVQYESHADRGDVAETVDCALRSLLASARSSTELAPGLHLMGTAEAGAGLWAPDPVTGKPRVISTVETTVKSVP
jgi:hypothetical protein